MTISLKDDSIVLIEEMEAIKTKPFWDEILSNGNNIEYYYECGIHKVILNEKNKKFQKCLLYKDLLNIIKIYEDKEKDFNQFILHGLPSDSNKESLIAIYNQNDPSFKTHYFHFPKVSNEDRVFQLTDYDIPMYFKDINKSFSIFCSFCEKKKIDYYSKQKNNKLDIDNRKSTEINQNNLQLGIIPLPRKEHCFCQICYKKFDDYLFHLNSNEHLNALEKNKHIFENINKTIERVRNKYKEININNNCSNKNKIKNGITYVNNDDNNNKRDIKYVEISNSFDTITNEIQFEEIIQITDDNEEKVSNKGENKDNNSKIETLEKLTDLLIHLEKAEIENNKHKKQDQNEINSESLIDNKIEINKENESGSFVNEFLDGKVGDSEEESAIENENDFCEINHYEHYEHYKNKNDESFENINNKINYISQIGNNNLSELNNNNVNKHENYLSVTSAQTNSQNNEHSNILEKISEKRNKIKKFISGKITYPQNIYLNKKKIIEREDKISKRYLKIFKYQNNK